MVGRNALNVTGKEGRNAHEAHLNVAEKMRRVCVVADMIFSLKVQRNNLPKGDSLSRVRSIENEVIDYGASEPSRKQNSDEIDHCRDVGVDKQKSTSEFRILAAISMKKSLTQMKVTRILPARDAVSCYRPFDEALARDPGL